MRDTDHPIDLLVASRVPVPAAEARSPHPHVGRERRFALEGGFAGYVVRAGEGLKMAAGIPHSPWGLPGPACVCAALLRVGRRG